MTDLGTASLTHPGSTEAHHDVVRLGSARGGWFRRVGWRHAVGVLALAFSLFPILFMVSAAFNPLGTLSSSQLIPTGASLQNFSRLLDTSFPIWFLNSMIIGGLAAALSMFFSACAAFAFSRFRFRGRRPGCSASCWCRCSRSSWPSSRCT